MIRVFSPIAGCFLVNVSCAVGVPPKAGSEAVPRVVVAPPKPQPCPGQSVWDGSACVEALPSRPATDPAAETPPAAHDPSCVRTISDGESNSNENNLGGYWFTYSDRSGSSIDPVSGALGGSFQMTKGGAAGTKYAARMRGRVGTGTVYTGMGLNFVDPRGAFDATGYSALAFYARRGERSTDRVRVKVPDMQTDPDGGICQECFNDFGADIQVGTEWRRYVLAFDAMKQQRGRGNPRPPSIDPAALFGVIFEVTEPGADFDVWVDQIEFVRCE